MYVLFCSLKVWAFIFWPQKDFLSIILPGTFPCKDAGTLGFSNLCLLLFLSHLSLFSLSDSYQATQLNTKELFLSLRIWYEAYYTQSTKLEGIHDKNLI